MLKRFKLEEGSAPLVLVWLMVLAAAYAIQRADLMVGLNILPYVTTIAVVVGYILSRTTFSSSTAHLISLVYGLTTIVLLVGSTELPLRERILDLINRQVDWLTKGFSAGAGVMVWCLSCIHPGFSGCWPIPLPGTPFVSHGCGGWFYPPGWFS